MDLVLVAAVIFAIGALAGYLLTRLDGGTRLGPLTSRTSVLLDHDEQLRRMFEQTPVGLLITAPDGRLLYVNKAFRDSLGYTEQELLNLNFQDITHPDDIASSLALLQTFFEQDISTCEIEK